MINLLEHPAPAYRKFVDNQVLTDDQLNALVDHLNYQDRLSRVLLSGVGIVCGLEVALVKNRNGISLSTGVAVTTDGNLLKMADTAYKGFKLFKDENAKYPRFANEGATLPLWELETETSASDVSSLNAFEEKVGFSLEKAVAVLYLEDYLKEEEDCSPVDCDTQGQEAVNRLRLLLVSPEHAKTIAEGDSIYAGTLSEGSDPLIDSLPHFFAKRVVLTPANTSSYETFKKAYVSSFSELADRITQLGTLPLLEEIPGRVEVDPATDLSGYAVSYLNIQYIYDFYKDLATAYNELRGLLVRNYAICCPDPKAFPKHILLGTLTGTKRSWRHRFYPSPILNGYLGFWSIQRHFTRLLLMIKQFATGRKEQIVITPSKKEEAPLGEQAIPFYYSLQAEQEAAPFYNNWVEDTMELAPNYFGYNYPDSNFDPLEVCMPGHDFFRIEGHLGRHVMDAHKDIQETKEEKGLAFDIMPIAIGKNADEDTIDYDKYRVYFEDLQVVLQAWNEEQQCLMKSAGGFFSKFSLAQPGTHLSFEAVNVNADSDRVFTPGLMRRIEAQPLFFERKSSKITPQKNVVLEGIVDEKDTLGLQILNNISVSDNKNDILVKSRNAVNDIVKDWDAEIVEATVNIPLDLLGHLKETEDNKLTNIEDFTEENLKKYIEALQAQCQKTNDSKKKFQALSRLENSKVKAQPWREPYEFTLNRIIASCCMIEKIKVLYEKILERKGEVLEQLVLHNFIERHPGAEHRAGVEKGGTFVLLYYSTGQDWRPSIPSIRPAEALTAIPRERFQPIEPATSFTRGLGIRRFPDFENIPHGTVIGDLYLPYICCSTTPATTFVFPEQLATLRLPVDHVCMEEEGENEQILMSVTPADGTVAAFVNQRELGSVIIKKDNGTFFDPNEVSPDDFGKPIRFEVNGQAVDPTLVLFRKPQAGFTFAADIVFRNSNTLAIVTFENTSVPFEELTFEWDFGTGTQESRDALKFTHGFNVRPGRNFDFDVTLLASNGSCSDRFSESVNIDVPDLEQPEEKCEEINLASINAALASFEQDERILEQAPAELKAIHKNVVQVYRGVVGRPDEAFKGGLDQEVFPAIQRIQFQLTDLLANLDSQVHQTFLLKVYHELILLYFYIQACRDAEIVIDAQISDVVGSWPDFSRNATEKFTEALSALLKVNKLNAKLEDVLEEMQDRMVDELRTITEQIAKILDDFIEE